MDSRGLVLAGWNFETLRTGTLVGLLDSRLQRFPGLEICRVPALRLHLKKRGTVGLARIIHDSSSSPSLTLPHSMGEGWVGAESGAQSLEDLRRTRAVR